MTNRTYTLTGVLTGFGAYELERTGYDLFFIGCPFRVKVSTEHHQLIAVLLNMLPKTITVEGEHDGTMLYVTSIK